MKNLFILILFVIFNVSCKNTVNNSHSKATDTNITTVKLKTVEVDIEGMTCEIGCARTIESELSKVNGVIYSKVDFNTKKGYFTFDENKLNDYEITHKINEIAGGDVYKATKTILYEKIIKK